VRAGVPSITTAGVRAPTTGPGRWYVVHTQSGYEKKVKQNLEARIAR
jgi:transcription termination/antitermination protein NusG